MVAAACLVCGSTAQAQYKGARNYFPKNYPAPNSGGQTPAPGSPSSPATPDKSTPAKPQQPKFKDLELNAQFYFLTDTNRAYAWMKLSKSTAKNTKNGLTQTISGETPVQK
jgi:hypothetical protein